MKRPKGLFNFPKLDTACLVLNSSHGGNNETPLSSSEFREGIKCIKHLRELVHKLQFLIHDKGFLANEGQKILILITTITSPRGHKKLGS